MNTLRLLAAIAFITIGLAHLLGPVFFASIVPPYLPAPLLLVYLSGLAEIAGGVGLLIPRLRRAAGFGLIALLVAVFPANLHMALNPHLFADLPTAALYARLPIQILLIYAIYLLAIRTKAD